jgi:uncharacterized protein YebE (UPF0316 family)
MISKGNKYMAPILGFFEVLIWVIVIGKVMQNLDHWINIIAYAAGYATGNLVGLIIEDKVAIGIVRIQIITAMEANDLISNLIKGGYGITHHEANGANGRVSIIYSIINRKQIPIIAEMISKHNPHAFYTIEDVKFANKGIIPANPVSRWRVGK